MGSLNNKDNLPSLRFSVDLVNSSSKINRTPNPLLLEVFLANLSNNQWLPVVCSVNLLSSRHRREACSDNLSNSNSNSRELLGDSLDSLPNSSNLLVGYLDNPLSSSSNSRHPICSVSQHSSSSSSSRMHLDLLYLARIIRLILSNQTLLVDSVHSVKITSSNSRDSSNSREDLVRVLYKPSPQYQRGALGTPQLYLGRSHNSPSTLTITIECDLYERIHLDWGRCLS